MCENLPGLNCCWLQKVWEQARPQLNSLPCAQAFSRLLLLLAILMQGYSWSTSSLQWHIWTLGGRTCTVYVGVASDLHTAAYRQDCRTWETLPRLPDVDHSGVQGCKRYHTPLLAVFLEYATTPLSMYPKYGVVDHTITFYVSELLRCQGKILRQIKHWRWSWIMVDSYPGSMQWGIHANPCQLFGSHMPYACLPCSTWLWRSFTAVGLTEENKDLLGPEECLWNNRGRYLCVVKTHRLTCHIFSVLISAITRMSAKICTMWNRYMLTVLTEAHSGLVLHVLLKMTSASHYLYS